MPALMVVLAVGLGFTAYSLFFHSGADSLTVTELKSQAESFSDRQVKVEGRIVPGSISWDERTKEISFALADDKGSLTVVYEGVIPDSFKPGTDLVVEGTYNSDNTLQASSLGSRRSLCTFCH